LASAFTEHADLLAKLPGSFDNMLSDIVLASDPLVVFIPGLDPQRRNDGQDDQQEQSTRQADTNDARNDDPPRSIHIWSVHASVRKSPGHRPTPAGGSGQCEPTFVGTVKEAVGLAAAATHVSHFAIIQGIARSAVRSDLRPIVGRPKW
jgi:hypothetical protein